MSTRVPERHKLLLCLTCLIVLTTTGACERANQASLSPAQTAPVASIVAVQTEPPMGAGKLPDLTATARAPTAVIATPAPTLTPFRPPTPVLPLDQTLREFPRDALLYLADNHYLMLADATGTHQLWLSAAPCLTSNVPSPWGEWSADGRFLVVVCAIEADNGRGFPIKQATLFDMDEGVVTRIGSGASVTPQWSPVGSRLLLNVRRAVIAGVSNGELLNAATVLFERGAGTVTQLPVTADWASVGYYRLGAGLKLPPAVPRGEPRSAIAWSPDGSRFALVRVESEGGGLYVLDGDGSDPQRIAAVEATPDYVGIQSLVGWSADGHWLEVVRLVRTRGPQTNSDPQRIWVNPDIGEVHTNAPTSSPPGWWSPDRQWYLAFTNDTSQSLALFRADGTHVHMVAVEWNGGVTEPLWTSDSQRFIIVKTTPQKMVVVVEDLAGHEQIIRSIPLDAGGAGLIDLAVTHDREHVALGLCPSSPDTCRVIILTLAGEERAVIPGGGSAVRILNWRP